MYTSGRTIEQGIRSCVLEGKKLYVTPKRFSMMQATLVVNQSNPDEAARVALKQAGLLDSEIFQLYYTGLEIIVDRELID